MSIHGFASGFSQKVYMDDPKRSPLSFQGAEVDLASFDLNKLGISGIAQWAARDLVEQSSKITLIANSIGVRAEATAIALMNHRLSRTRRGIARTHLDVKLEYLDLVAEDEPSIDGVDALTHAVEEGDYDTVYVGAITDNLAASAAIRYAAMGLRVIGRVRGSNTYSAITRWENLLEPLVSKTEARIALGGIIHQELVRLDGPKRKAGMPNDVPILTVCKVGKGIVGSSNETMLKAELEESSFVLGYEEFQDLVEGGFTVAF